MLTCRYGGGNAAAVGAEPRAQLVANRFVGFGSAKAEGGLARPLGALIAGAVLGALLARRF